MEKKEGNTIRRPKSKKEKPRSSTCKGKTGVKASQPVHRKKLVPNIAYNSRSYSPFVNHISLSRIGESLRYKLSKE